MLSYCFPDHSVPDPPAVKEQGEDSGKDIRGRLGGDYAVIARDRGQYGDGGAVTAVGGVVTATGGSLALGIGKGSFGSDNGTLTVAEDVTVKAGASADPQTVLTRGAGGVVEGIVSQQYFVLVKSGLEPLVLKDGAGALSDARTGVPDHGAVLKLVGGQRHRSE